MEKKITNKKETKETSKMDPSKYFIDKVQKDL
jgi:hypothetical protein